MRRTPLDQEDEDAHELQEHEFTLEPEDADTGPFDEHTAPWGTLPLPPLPPWATTARALLEPPTLPGRAADVYDEHPTPAAEPIAISGMQLRALREELALALGVRALPCVWRPAF